ncbi:MAG: CsgG/HfaB family protein [Acidobacteriota bacterium]|nr:CsgG/HfaB family protein [Acidobacteriota bacterium]MDH3784053.1 CsgG/HfaB family protein [Acidobacteriota bacterium]
MNMRKIMTKGMAAVAALLMVVAIATPVRAEMLAHAVTEKNGTVPLPESLDAIAQSQPTDLVQLEWSDFGGKRSRVRVLTTENKTGSGDYSAKVSGTGPNGEQYNWTYDVNTDYGKVPIEGLDAMLTDILLQTGRFDVVERESLGAILGEQDLADGGRVAAPSAAKKGKVLGAQMGIKLVINAYEPEVKSKKRGLGGIGRMIGGRAGAVAGRVNWQNAESRVGITVQIINMETSQIFGSKQVDVRLKARNIGFGAGGWGMSGALGGFMSNYSATPIGQAMIAAVNVGVHHIVKGIGAQVPEGVVADVSPGKVMVTMGKGQVETNDLIRAVALGKEIFHPETGVLLSRDEVVIGELRITDVQDGFSFATPIDGTDLTRLAAGDKVVATRAPAAYEYGPDWDLRGGIKKAVGKKK